MGREDLEERDAFAQRVIKRDKEKQRNAAEKSDKHGYEESAKRLALDNENREKNLGDLRKQSRRQYLSKRKEDKMLELKDDIADDEFLFDDSQLTDRERRERNYKKTVLNLATAHTKAAEIEKVQRYVMPEDRKKGQFDDYVEIDDNEKGPQSEQKIWEKKKEKQAQYSFVSDDKRKKQEEKSKKY